MAWVKCPGCGLVQQVAVAVSGAVAHCSACGQPFRVQLPDPPGGKPAAGPAGAADRSEPPARGGDDGPGTYDLQPEDRRERRRPRRTTRRAEAEPSPQAEADAAHRFHERRPFLGLAYVLFMLPAFVEAVTAGGWPLGPKLGVGVVCGLAAGVLAAHFFGRSPKSLAIGLVCGLLGGVAGPLAMHYYVVGSAPLPVKKKTIFAVWVVSALFPTLLSASVLYLASRLLTPGRLGLVKGLWKRSGRDAVRQPSTAGGPLQPAHPLTLAAVAFLGGLAALAFGLAIREPSLPGKLLTAGMGAMFFVGAAFFVLALIVGRRPYNRRAGPARPPPAGDSRGARLAWGLSCGVVALLTATCGVLTLAQALFTQAAPINPLALFFGGPAPDPGGRRTDHDVFAQSPREYLSDLQEYDVKRGPWPFAREGDVGNGTNRIAVNGVPSPKGLGMHPWDNDYSAVKYRLGGKAAAFRARVAIDDSSHRARDAAVFEVLGDGRSLWQSAPVRRSREPQDCRIDVRGVDVLELRVHARGSHFGLHAVWVEPRVLQKPDTPDD
jgi:hypothetical protein